MKLLSGVLVVCLFTVPSLGTPVVYTFSATGGSVLMNVVGNSSSSSPATGTFAVIIEAGSDDHIGQSDTFLLEDAALTNTRKLDFNLAGLTRGSNVPAGGIRFLDFAPSGPGHIGAGGAATIETDVFAEVTIMWTGLFSSTFTTSAWAGSLLPCNLSFSTSVGSSDVLTASLTGAYRVYWPAGGADVITFDFILNVQGTAHVVPDPSLSGLIGLGLGGTGFWLRRRRWA